MGRNGFNKVWGVVAIGLMILLSSSVCLAGTLSDQEIIKKCDDAFKRIPYATIGSEMVHRNEEKVLRLTISPVWGMGTDPVAIQVAGTMVLGCLFAEQGKDIQSVQVDVKDRFEFHLNLADFREMQRAGTFDEEFSKKVTFVAK